MAQVRAHQVQLLLNEIQTENLRHADFYTKRLQGNTKRVFELEKAVSVLLRDIETLKGKSNNQKRLISHLQRELSRKPHATREAEKSEEMRCALARARQL